MSPDEIAAIAALDESIVNAAIVAMVHWLQIGVAVIDAQLRLRHANPSAHALFAQGTHLRIDDGRVVGAHPRATRDLVALLQSARCASGVRPCVAPISANGLGALELVVHATEESALGRCFVVMLKDICSAVTGSAHALQSLHGLTAAEAQVVLRLARGRTVAEAAAELGIGIATARTHLHHALRKTGTRRQAELVGLIASSLSNSMREALPSDAPAGKARGLHRMIESAELTAARGAHADSGDRIRVGAAALRGARATEEPRPPSIDCVGPPDTLRIASGSALAIQALAAKARKMLLF